MKKCILYLLSIIITGAVLSAQAKEYHVSKKGNDKNNGSVSKPFLTIAAAVNVAHPGDTITVHAGTYREWVNPLRGGTSDAKRITYRAAPHERVEIKGSEVISNWQKAGNGVWKVVIPNSFFGDYNPYQDSIHGDWFVNKGRIHHTGEVFLNNKSLFEKETLAKVQNPVADTTISDRDGSRYAWYCESNAHQTTIWANFHQYNPNRELVEISTRRTCFYPKKKGINYLTISGFYISEAATQWGAPTAEQVGIVATNWNKGWIIENNVISNSKCMGISLGKEKNTGQNVWTADKGSIYNDGNVDFLEVIFNATRYGWNKANVGSHMVRGNTIFNCEQAGIGGSLGAVFSIIENNIIYNIWTKKQFYGYEMGGIKFHAPIDVQIIGNRIHDSVKGIWLDWMTQGTRISGNIFYRNGNDLFLEVDHGPYIVDNNIFLSPNSISNRSEGGAYLHNLIAGTVTSYGDPRRATPYFLPHSTAIAALTTVFAGDDRFYNNIFIGKGSTTGKVSIGLETYNKAKLSVWLDGNVYLYGAKPSLKDTNALNQPEYNPGLLLEDSRKEGLLNFNFHAGNTLTKWKVYNSTQLGKAKISKAAFENPDGTTIIFDKDFSGHQRTAENNMPGPFINQDSAPVKLW